MAGPARAPIVGQRDRPPGGRRRVARRPAGPGRCGRPGSARRSRLRHRPSPPARRRTGSAAPAGRAASACPARRATGVGRVNRAGRASAAWMAGARGHRQLAVDVLDVAFDGVAGQMQLVGDLPVAQPLGHRCRIWSSRGLSVSPGGGLAGCAGAGRSSAMMRRATKGSIGAPPRSCAARSALPGRRVPSAGSRWRRRAAPEWRPRCSRPR